MTIVSWAKGIGSDVSLDGFSDSELIDCYANAKATALCLGHFKGEVNCRLMGAYKDELESRGVDISKVTADDGVFNGKGSY